MNQMLIKCIKCLNTVSHRWNMTNDDKLFMECNILHMELRDEGGLIFLLKVVVIIHRIIKIIFEESFQIETLLNDYYHSYSSSQVVLITLKQILLNIIKDSTIFIEIIQHCNSCNINRFHAVDILLIITFSICKLITPQYC